MLLNYSKAFRLSILCVLALAALALVSAPVQAQSQAELVGHWRATAINFGQPTDENLVLNANGTFQNWTVVPDGRSEVTSGRWSAEGKSIIIVPAGGSGSSIPFTFHDGKLVLPNIPGQRGFFERVR